MAAVIKRVGQITHYSMSTGIASQVDWGNLSPGIIESLLPTIANGYHDLPLKGYGVGVGISRHHAGWISGAHAVVFYETRLAGAFTVALTPDDADLLWKSSEAHYLRFTDRGLPNRAVNYRHALKNTLVPVITIIGLQFGNIFAFSIVVETVFQWPGLGLLVIQSIQFADVPLLAAYLVMIALGFAMLNLCIDLLYAAIDPRVRTGMISARARS